MKNNIKHGVSNYRMPLYMQEILVQNYCPHFMRMSILKEGEGRWEFIYDTESYQKINADLLDSIGKLTLIQTLFKLRDSCEEWLIKAEEYRIEPDLIYCRNGVSLDRVKLLFYPDYDKRQFSDKMIAIIDSLKTRHNKIEAEMLEQIKAYIKTGEEIKSRQLIERNMMRLKMDENYRAG